MARNEQGQQEAGDTGIKRDGRHGGHQPDHQPHLEGLREQREGPGPIAMATIARRRIRHRHHH